MTVDFEQLDVLPASDVARCDLFEVIVAEAEWCSKQCRAQVPKQHGRHLDRDDLVHEIMVCISDRARFMQRLSSKPAGTRARAVRAFLISIIKTQWRRRFFAAYTAVGHTELSDDNLASFHCESLEQDAIQRTTRRELRRAQIVQVEAVRPLLTTSQFEVLHALCVDSLSVRDISRVMGCSVNNVYAHTRRIRKILEAEVE